MLGASCSWPSFVIMWSRAKPLANLLMELRYHPPHTAAPRPRCAPARGRRRDSRLAVSDVDSALNDFCLASAPPWPERPCVVPPVKGGARFVSLAVDDGDHVGMQRPLASSPLDGAGEYLELASSPSAGLARSTFIDLAG